MLFFLYSEDDPFEDLSRSGWERLDNTVNEAYNATVENEETGKCVSVCKAPRTKS